MVWAALLTLLAVATADWSGAALGVPLSALALVGVCLRSAYRQYGIWTAQGADHLLSRITAQAFTGAGIVSLGCIGLHFGSQWNNRWIAAFAFVTTISGFLPIVYAVEVDVARPPPAGQRSGGRWLLRVVGAPFIRSVIRWLRTHHLLERRWFATLLNLAIVAIAMTPLVLILGVPVLLSALIGGLWLVFNLLQRAHLAGALAYGAVAAMVVCVAVWALSEQFGWNPAWWLTASSFALFFLAFKVQSIWVAAWLTELRKGDSGRRAPTWLSVPQPRWVGALGDWRDGIWQARQKSDAATSENRTSQRAIAAAQPPTPRITWPRAIALFCGGGMVTAIGGLGLRAELGAARPLVVVVAAVALAAFGATFVTRGEGYALLAVVSIVLVWAIDDRDAESPVRQPGSGPTIVVLGDSYSSGEGATAYLAGTDVEGGNNCRRSPHAYGFQVAERLHGQVSMYACSGAKAAQIAGSDVNRDGQITDDERVGQISTPDRNGIAGIKVQVDNVEDPLSVDLVLLTIGGNDALFSKIGMACVLPGTCTDVAPAINGNLSAVRVKVASALFEVGSRFANARVVLLAYPYMLADGAPCNQVPLDADEFVYLNNFLQDLNSRLSGAVTDVNEQLVDLKVGIGTPDRPQIRFFDGAARAYRHAELCSADGTPDPTEAPINVINLQPTEATHVFDRLNPGKWKHNTFHPTEQGHNRTACALGRWLAQALPELVPEDSYSANDACPSDPYESVDLPIVEYEPCRNSCVDEVEAFVKASLVSNIRRILWWEGIALLVVGWASGLLAVFGRSDGSVAAWKQMLRPGRTVDRWAHRSGRGGEDP